MRISIFISFLVRPLRYRSYRLLIETEIKGMFAVEMYSTLYRLLVFFSISARSILKKSAKYYRIGHYDMKQSVRIVKSKSASVAENPLIIEPNLPTLKVALTCSLTKFSPLNLLSVLINIWL